MKLISSNSLLRATVICLGIAMPLESVLAQAFTGKSWPGSKAGFYVKYDNGPFDDAFIDAARQWDGLGGFSLSTATCQYIDPCASVSNFDRLPSYKFSSNNCGTPWNPTELGFTRFWFVASTQLVDADIVFNSNRNWGIHNNNTSSPFDFRRVASHEIGHALGFAHSQGQTIMTASYSNSIKTPQQQDINGMNALYSSASDKFEFDLCPQPDFSLEPILPLLLD